MTTAKTGIVISIVAELILHHKKVCISLWMTRPVGLVNFGICL